MCVINKKTTYLFVQQPIKNVEKIWERISKYLHPNNKSKGSKKQIVGSKMT